MSKELAVRGKNEVATVRSIFESGESFDLACRMANALAKSTIVPKEYQGNVSNALIAIDVAQRLGTSPMLVMQNLYVVNGKPAWSSAFITATINASGKYKTELQFEMTGKGETLACYAWAEDHNGHVSKGPEITWKMAKAEGWIDRNGSKWKTMPEVMIRYRAASFFGRMFCPEMILGIYSKEEVIELGEDDFTVIETEIRENANKEIIDADTGEVKEEGQEEQPKEVETEVEESATPDF